MKKKKSWEEIEMPRRIHKFANMHHHINNKLAEIRSLCSKANVNMLYVFGSVLTSKFNKDSDIDFVVEFNTMSYEDYADQYFKFCDELELLLNRKVDVLTPASIKNPYFKKKVDQTKQLIFSGSAV
jgi:predicted nucleotidyltransferase